VLNYLYTTKDLVMQFAALASKLAFNVYSKTTNLSLYAYSDALFVDAKDRKSTLGYLFKFASGTVYYRSCKQKLITTSITKAKYVKLTYAAKEAT
jgi:hypothetical protein